MSTTSQPNTTTLLILVATVLVIGAVWYKNKPSPPAPTTPIVVKSKRVYPFMYTASGNDVRRKKFLQRYNPYDFMRTSVNYRKEHFAPEFDLATQTLSSHPLTIQYSPVSFSHSNPHGLKSTPHDGYGKHH